MSSVIVGNAITVEAHYRLDGILTDPSLPRVTIRDVNGVAQVTDATPTRLGTGIYQYVYAVALNAPLGAWQAEWSGVISGQPQAAAEWFTVLPVGYITPTPSSSFTYNLATDVGKVRLNIDDRDMTNATTAVPLERRSCIFTDEEVQTFIDAHGGDLFKASAMALRVIANNRSLLVLRRTIGKTDVDFGQLRADLLKSADAMEAMSDNGAGPTPADGYAEIVWGDFSLRQVMTNQMLREG